jgi:hypothetical protein
MATDPALIHEVAERGQPVGGAGLEGDLQELVGFGAMACPNVGPPPQPSFSSIAHRASGLRVSCIAVLAL